MENVKKIKEEMGSMSDERLTQARALLKNNYKFYWKITQEPNIDLTRPRGKSASENCVEINKVGLALKAEIEKRNPKES